MLGIRGTAVDSRIRDLGLLGLYLLWKMRDDLEGDHSTKTCKSGKAKDEILLGNGSMKRRERR